MKINISGIKAISVDLDGTIVRKDGTLSDYTAGVLRRCQAQGLRIVICTGRSPEASEKYCAAIGAEGPMVYFNGAEVLHRPHPQKSAFYTGLVPLEVLEYCTLLAREQDLYFQAYFPEYCNTPRLSAEKKSPEWHMYAKHTGTEPCIGDLLEVIRNCRHKALSGAIKGMFITRPERQEELRGSLLEKFGTSIYVTRTLDTFLEVMLAGIDKSTGLRVAVHELGLKAEEVLAFGDEENDLPVFAYAGLSGAPANAKQCVLDAADFIVAPCALDGVAHFLTLAKM